jgi:hypothetical protein
MSMSCACCLELKNPKLVTLEGGSTDGRGESKEEGHEADRTLGVGAGGGCMELGAEAGAVVTEEAKDGAYVLGGQG